MDSPSALNKHVDEAGDELVGRLDDARYDLSNLALSDVVRCGYSVRQMAAESRSLEDVAGRIVNHLFQACRNPETGESELALARFFKTHPFGDLDDALQQAARSMAPDVQLDDETRCLTLLATAGERREWNDRRESQGHRAIPLLSEATVSQIPMIAQLVRQFGLELSSVVRPSRELLIELDQRNYNVFHVEDALGSPFIPAQEEFVRPLGVRSVLGFGGMLPTGNLFAVILFSKASISRASAEAFRTIALKIKASILPFEEIAVFDDRGDAVAGRQNVDHLATVLRSKVGALEELEGVYDRMVIEQSGRLEQIVRDLATANQDLQSEIESRKQAEAERERLHRQLQTASRQAGMAEIAVGVLHDVGNALNGVNVSASLIMEMLKRSKAPRLRRASDLLAENKATLGEFLTADQRGKEFPNFLATLADALERESIDLLEESKSLEEGVNHIKAIVSAQQSYATTSGVQESVVLDDAIADALKIAGPSLERHNVKIVCEFVESPRMLVDKHKLLQVVVNLINNAKSAVLVPQARDRLITIKVYRCDETNVVIEVRDTGIGVAKENLAKIFAQGFTTRANQGGHGFGLHYSANAAIELGGSLAVESDGVGQGAVFRLKLPLSGPARKAGKGAASPSAYSSERS